MITALRTALHDAHILLWYSMYSGTAAPAASVQVRKHSREVPRIGWIYSCVGVPTVCLCTCLAPTHAVPVALELS
eukprot:4187314-Amphidinium_carterae.1